MVYFLLITIIMDFDKNFDTICLLRIWQSFLSEHSTVKCNFIIIVSQVLGQKKICIFVKPKTGNINRYKYFFIFQWFKRMFSIHKSHYCCSAITQLMARSHVIFSHFNIYFNEDINNLIFQIFTFSGLVDNLQFYIFLSAKLVSIFYFNFIIYQGIF